MFINEVLKSVVPYRYDKEAEAYLFEIGNVLYEAMFDSFWVDDLSDFGATAFGQDISEEALSQHDWNKLLTLLKPPGREILIFQFGAEEQGKDPTIKLTGFGNTYQVLSTVLEILQEQKRQTPDAPILVGADKNEPSRVKLYQRLMSNMNHIKIVTAKEVAWLLI